MEALLVIAAIAGAAWAVLLGLRGSLLAGCLIFLLIACCFGPYFATFDTGVLNMSLERFFAVGLAAAFVAQRKTGQLGPPAPLRRGDVALLALTAWILFSAVTHDWRRPDVPVWQHIAAGYGMPLLLYWIARSVSMSERTLGATYGCMVGFGVYLAVTGLCEVTGQWGGVFPRYIADPEIGQHFGRARGPMVQAISFGLYLGVCILCGTVWWPRLGRIGRVGLLALLPLGLAGIFFCYTRSVWLGTAMAMLILSAAMLRGAWRPLVLGCAVAAALLIGITKMDRILAFDRNDNSASETRGSVDLRGSFAFVSWKMFLDSPLVGVGFGQFPDAKLPYLTDPSTELNLEILRPMVHHNMFLSILTELGAVGMVLFLATFYFWTADSVRLLRDPHASPWVRNQGLLTLAVVVLFLTQCLFHETSFSPLDHSLVFFFAGLTSGIAGRTAPSGLSDER